MLELSSTFLGGEGGGGAGEEGGKVRVSSAYPAWRRAARLSYALSDVLAQVAGGEGDARVGDGVGGAPSPIAELLHRELSEWRERYLAPERLREEGHFVPEGVARLLREARQRGGPKEETSVLWRLICFQRWFARHHGGEGVAVR